MGGLSDLLWQKNKGLGVVPSTLDFSGAV